METDSRDSGIVLNGITEDIKRTEAVISYKQFERSSLAESTICESRQNSELVKEYGKNIRKILIVIYFFLYYFIHNNIEM